MPSSRNTLPLHAPKFPLCAAVVSGFIFPFLCFADHFGLALTSVFFLGCAFMPTRIDARKPEAVSAWGKHVKFPKSITCRRIAPFKYMTSLISVSLAGCRRIDDHSLSFLKGLSNLKSLDLSGCEGIYGTGFIHMIGLPITYLNLCGCRGVDYLEHISGLPLVHLDLSSCFIKPRHVRALNRMYSLKYLSLRDNWRIGCNWNNGVSALAHLKMLQIDILDLHGCWIRNEDLLHLHDCKYLRYLDISDGRFDDDGLLGLNGNKFVMIILSGCKYISETGLRKFTSWNREALIVGPCVRNIDFSDISDFV